MLGDDPRTVNLFDHAGLIFPQSATPLTVPLAIAFVVIFLLDVAVRRIAIDWAPVRRGVAAILRRKPKANDQTIDRLQVRREQVRKQLDDRGKQTASRRFEAPAGAAGDLPTTNVTPPPLPRKPAQPATEPAPPPPSQTDDSTMGRLLRAKKKASDGMQGKS